MEFLSENVVGLSEAEQKLLAVAANELKYKLDQDRENGEDEYIQSISEDTGVPVEEIWDVMEELVIMLPSGDEE